MLLLVVLVTAVGCFSQLTSSQEFQTPPVIAANDGTGMCPSDEVRTNAMNDVQRNVRDIMASSVGPFLSACGPGNWRRVFYVNASEACPSGWRASLTQKSERACRSHDSACVSAFTQGPLETYSDVCGRVTGDAHATVDAFNNYNRAVRRSSIESNYVDGVSITYGQSGSRTHIWTFGATGGTTCPCHHPSHSDPPLAVGHNYFCDRISNTKHLWDGVDCPNNDPCCSYNSPPFFKVSLQSPTTENIEVRICQDQAHGDETSYLLFAEIYVK